VEMAAQFRIFNNGSSPTLEQSIERSKTYSEELTLAKTSSSSLSHLHKISVDVSVSAKVKAGIPFIAEGEIETALSTGYGFESPLTSQDRHNRLHSQRGRLQSIRKSISHLVPFTLSELTSMPSKICPLSLRQLWTSPVREMVSPAY
jgi:hypothetical protein